MEFKDYTIERFLGELESSLPSPGGGSVAGLVAALSGALNRMVYSLTIGKKKYDELDDDIKEKILSFDKESKSFIEKSKSLMEEDRKYFNELMDCYKLSKDTEEEKVARSEAIRVGTIKAMEAPLTLTREAVKFYENIELSVKYGNRMLISDSGVAAILLNAAIQSGIINVKVNLNSLRKEEFSSKIEEELLEIEKESRDRMEKILVEVNNNIYPA